MELQLRRSLHIAPDALPGELTIEGAHVVWTLERVGVQIPTGRYQLTLYPSPHFKRVMPLLVDVPGRSMIEIHFGNVPGASDGCILVGDPQDPTTGDVLNSVKAFNALFPVIEGAIESGEGAWITVA
jgi:hypothetical protein